MEGKDNIKKDQDEKCENVAVERGGEFSAEQPLRTRDDKGEHHKDDKMSISQMREEAKKGDGDKLEDQKATQENGKDDDAMNYKNDRDHGAYNPKNI